MENQILPLPSKTGGDVLVSELVAGFLGHAESRLDRTGFQHFKRAVSNLIVVYGEHSVNELSPKKLKVCRNQMLKSGTLCRSQIIKHVGRIIRIFAWEVEEEHIRSNVVAALGEVKNLQHGEKGTFDNPPRL
ncbi:MAG: hypothetical protein ACRC2T_07505 [Thermoguttaceae bacterium]